MHQTGFMIWLLIILPAKSLLGLEVVSTNKTAYHISTATNNNIPRVAGLAVDGNTDTDYYGGNSCSSTRSNSDPNPWWYVDLQNIYSVSNVSIYSGNESRYKRRLVDIQIRVGNDTLPPFSGNIKCGSTITEDMALDDNPVTMECNQTIGQYVTLYRTGNDTDRDSLTLCEVEVYADTEAPVVTCPDDVSVGTDPGQPTATVTWSAPIVTDNLDTNLPVTCTTGSSLIDNRGSLFVIGETTVACQSTDNAGNAGSCSFSVVISDTEAPVVTCPGDVSVGTGPCQPTATVTWSDPTVSDNLDTNLSVTCTTDSSLIYTHGSWFDIGETTVACQSTDNAGNAGSCNFSVAISGDSASSVPGYLVAVVVILCVIILVLSPAFIIFYSCYYSLKNKGMEHSTVMNMTDYDDVEVPKTTTNAHGDDVYLTPNAAAPSKLESQTRFDSASEGPHTYTSVEPVYTNVKK